MSEAKEVGTCLVCGEFAWTKECKWCLHDLCEKHAKAHTRRCPDRLRSAATRASGHCGDAMLCAIDGSECLCSCALCCSESTLRRSANEERKRLREGDAP